MLLDMDAIQFESRWEINEVVQALREWQAMNTATDEKAKTVQELINKLELMYMSW